jgi:hypothetical protein
MDLEQAIQRAAKVVPKKKDLEAYQAIRLGSNPPLVHATDGQRHSVIAVEDEVPDFLLPSQPLVAAAKEGGLRFEVLGYGKVRIQSAASQYDVRALEVDHFPQRPVVDVDLDYAPDWSEVAKVFHAAAKATQNPDAALVHFTPWCVEATDQGRLARVSVRAPWGGLVPAELFKSWPKGEVRWGFSATHAYFVIEDSELRVARLVENPMYQRTADLVPELHRGPSMLVSTKALANAAKQGGDLSHLGLVIVEIDHERRTVTVRAWREKERQDKDRFAAAIRVQGVLGSPPNEDQRFVAVGVHGKYVVEALRQVKTPNVLLGHGAIADPLRLESGMFVECIWPMYMRDG